MVLALERDKCHTNDPATPDSGAEAEAEAESVEAASCLCGPPERHASDVGSSSKPKAAAQSTKGAFTATPLTPLAAPPAAVVVAEAC